MKIEQISGISFRAVEIAVAILKKSNLKVEDYDILVFERRNSLFVVFQKPVSPNETRFGGGFEVELNPDTLMVVRSGATR